MKLYELETLNALNLYTIKSKMKHLPPRWPPTYTLLTVHLARAYYSFDSIAGVHFWRVPHARLYLLFYFTDLSSLLD